MITKRYIKRLASLSIIKSKAGTAPKDLLVGVLESRLDSVINRLGYCSTHSQASQMISHKHVELNGRRVNVRSIILRPEDKVRVRFKYDPERLNKVPYVELYEDGFIFKVMPTFEQIPYSVNIDFNKVYGAL